LQHSARAMRACQCGAAAARSHLRVEVDPEREVLPPWRAVGGDGHHLFGLVWLIGLVDWFGGLFG